MINDLDFLELLLYIPMLETSKSHLQKFDTNLVFWYSNKLKTYLINNKPATSFQPDIYNIACKSYDQSYIVETDRE